MLSEGDRLPEFTLHSSERNVVTRDDFLGAPGVLVFFPRAFTAGCRTELRAFQHALEAFRAHGARLVAVSVDTWFENRRFATAEGLEFPLLSDWPAARTLAAFGVDDGTGRARRVTMVFDAAQVVRSVITNVEAGEHPARALAAIEKLVEADARASEQPLANEAATG